ncbi:lactacin F inducer peptide precursor [Lactobacillus taiwanensis]|nr:lactacin F inducer peptide precursor [Lactobacillus taiwanensis]
MKENKKEKVILTEEEMVEVVGGTRVNGFVNVNWNKGIFYWTRNIWK